MFLECPVPESSSPVPRLKGRIGLLKASGAPAEELAAARAELAAAVAADRIRREVEAAPPLSAETRRKLAALLDPGSGTS
jgi:hypothetical protein